MTAALEEVNSKQHTPAALYPGEVSETSLQEAGWTPVPFWADEKSRPTRFRSQDRPARSQSLYRLS